jgi:phosphoribosyl 1,2-cyclic phosphate phosphodiesterase
MNKITILGSGDTLGTPVFGCKSDACKDKDPKSKRFRFGLLIELEGKKILIDTNPDLKWQCLQSKFELKNIDTILITHCHSDHVNGMGEFFYRKTKPIPTYFLKDLLTKKNIDYFKYLEREKILKFIPYINYTSFELTNNIKITPIELNHGFPCSGFIIQSNKIKIGIITDTNFSLKEKTLDLLKNCDYLFVDAFSENSKQILNVYKDCELKPQNLKTEWFHMTFVEAKKLQKITKSKKLYTVHMSRYVSPHKKLVKKYQNDNFIVGYDGQIIKM